MNPMVPEAILKILIILFTMAPFICALIFISSFLYFNRRIDGPVFNVGKAECYLAIEECPEAPDWTGVFFCTKSAHIDVKFVVNIVDENNVQINVQL